MNGENIRKLKDYYDNLPEETREKYDNMDISDASKNISEISNDFLSSDMEKISISPETMKEAKMGEQGQKMKGMKRKEMLEMKKKMKIIREGISCILIMPNGSYKVLKIPKGSQEGWLEQKLGENFIESDLSEFETHEMVGFGLTCYYNPYIKGKNNKKGEVFFPFAVKGKMIICFQEKDMTISDLDQIISHAQDMGSV